jgi:ATP-binding cassette, subfamily B, multidrug efflux pump
MKTFKKLWRYIRNYKGLLFISISALIIVQILGLLAPLMIKMIFDDYITKIEQPWYVQQDTSGIFVSGKYYRQDKETEFGVSIVILDGMYVITDRVIPNGSIEINQDTLLVTTDNGIEIYNYDILSREDIQTFYSIYRRPVIFLMILLGIRFFLQIIFTYIQRITTSMINVNIVRDARNDAVTALQHMPMSYFESEPAGKVANRILSDTGGMMQLFSTIMNLVVNATFAVVFAYIGMFYLNVTLALYTFIAFPFIYVWLRFFMKRLKTIAERVSEKASLIAAQLNEIINGIQILQIFNFKKKTEDDFNDLSLSFNADKTKENLLHLSIGWNLIRLIGALVTAVIILYFGSLQMTVSGFIVTAGLIYAYNDYLTRLIEPLSILFREIGNLEHAKVKTERIFTIIDYDGEDTSFEEIQPFKGHIRFDDVYFSYKPGVPVLKHIYLDIQAGSFVGLVGHTGSGKSSLMNLLLRFYDIKSTDYGHIYIDGIDITTYSKRSYRQHLGIILQDPVMFKGTLRDNMLFGKTLEDEKLITLLEDIGGSELYSRMEQGLNTDISRKGGNISVGEKQLIAIARALIHNPSVLIMDEATANIDTETEMLLQKAIDKAREGRTLIVIAHRLSTIRKANQIIVLDQGLKIEEGTHPSLLEKNGVYANMYRAQVKSVE